MEGRRKNPKSFVGGKEEIYHIYIYIIYIILYIYTLIDE